MHYRCLLGLLLILGPDLSAQNVSLETGSDGAAAGAEVEIPIRLSTSAPVAGFSIACDWDSAIGQGVELRNPAVAPNDPGVLIHKVEVLDDHMIMVVVFNPAPVSNLIAAGNDILLGTLVIRCDPARAASTSSAISFTDGVYDTNPPGPSPIKNRVTVFSNNSFVELDDRGGLGLTDGSFRCGDGPDLQLAVENVSGSFNGEVEIPIRLSANAPVTGFTIACDWDSAVGAGVELRNLAVNPGDPGVLVHKAEVSTGHMIMVLALNPSPLTNLLPAGNDILLGNLVIRCGAGPLPAASAITFRDDVYDTAPPGLFPIRNRVSVFAAGQFSELEKATGLRMTDGSFECLPRPAFVRGDANDDAATDVSDAVTVLRCIFAGTLCPTCMDAADCNDDGTLDMSDALCVLNCLLLLGPCPDPPFPACTMDQTMDNLDCDRYTSC